jgi:hypothetical protein
MKCCEYGLWEQPVLLGMWVTFTFTFCLGDTPQGAGCNLKFAWAEFSTLSLAVFVMSAIAWYRQVHPHLDLKTRPMFFSCYFKFVHT